MTDETSKAEMQALSDRVGELEAVHGKPVKIEIEDFEGIRQLSHAIETQQLNRFALQNATPDRVFWGWFWAIVIGCAVLVVASLESSGHLF